MDKENVVYRSPIGARRVRTDLKTFENIFVSPNRLSARPPAAITMSMTASSQTSSKKLNNLHKNHMNNINKNSNISCSSSDVKTERRGNRLFNQFIIIYLRFHEHNESFKKMHDAMTQLLMYVALFFIHRSQLPARATRLLNRTRLNQGPISSAGSDSPRSIDSFSNRRSTSSRPSSQYGCGNANSTTGAPDDHLFMLDKTLRNSMIQDVMYCKQQLLQLRSILQDVSIYQWRTFFLLSF